MKTKGQIKKLNFNGYAFFKGISTSEAKWEFAEHLFPENWMDEVFKEGSKNQYLTKSVTPKIGVNDLVDVSKLDFTMRSNSHLDGKCQFKYLCDYYNKGIPNHKLLEYSEGKAFIKALKFTGKYSIINEILNPDQLKKLQERWLLRNTYMVEHWSDKTIEFIQANDWAEPFLLTNLFEGREIADQIKSYEQRKNPEKQKIDYEFENL